MTEEIRNVSMPSLDETESTQEFIDCYIDAMEEQYSVENLGKIETGEHLDRVFQRAERDWDLLEKRFSDTEAGQIAREVRENRPLSYFEANEQISLSQAQQLTWAVERIESNFVVAAANLHGGGLLSNLKRFVIGPRGVEYERFE